MNSYNELISLLNNSCPDGYISAYKIMQMLRDINKKQEILKYDCCSTMNAILRNHFNYEHYIDKRFEIILCGFDYDHDELYMTIINFLKEFERYYFSMKNGKLIITESNNALHKDIILSLIGDDLLSLYSSYYDLRPFRKGQCNIEVFNSPFRLNINFNALELYIPKNCLDSFMSLKVMTYVDEIHADSTKEDVCFLNDNYLQVLNHSFVKIDDCPRWVKSNLNSDKVLVKKNT